jgi:hypothetical protein
MLAPALSFWRQGLSKASRGGRPRPVPCRHFGSARAISAANLSALAAVCMNSATRCHLNLLGDVEFGVEFQFVGLFIIGSLDRVFANYGVAAVGHEYPVLGVQREDAEICPR